MMKYFFSLLLVVVLATSAYAADAKVWFTPMPGKEPVSLE
jgi:hypothetical protein